MATKIKRNESNIEKYRDNGNWNKLLDLCKQMTAKDNVMLIKFITTEANFERFLLDESVPQSKTCTDINNAKHAFSEVVQCKTFTNTELRMDCELILVKVFFFSGDTSATEARLRSIRLDTVKGVLPGGGTSNRRMRLLSEAYAIQGTLQEKEADIKDNSMTEEENELRRNKDMEPAIDSFTKATDLCFHHQQLLKYSQSSTNLNASLGSENHTILPFMENAITRGPMLLVNTGYVNKGISRFRSLLNADQVDALMNTRALLARELATVLLRGVADDNYLVVTRASLKKETSKHVKKYVKENLFMPKTRDEEILLLLLISESICSREVILNRSPEHTSLRVQSFARVKSVYTLLTIALCKYSHFDMLVTLYDRCMKFSFEEYSMWHQFAMALLNSQKYTRALLVFRECLRLKPKNYVLRMICAKICFENLHMIDEGMIFSEQALRDCEELQQEQRLQRESAGNSAPVVVEVFDLVSQSDVARCLLATGVGCSLKSLDAKSQSERLNWQTEALQIFLRSNLKDENDFLAKFYVALVCAELRKIDDAFLYIKKATRLRGDHLSAITLHILLLTCKQKNSDALNVVQQACKEFPMCFNLMFIKSRLEQRLGEKKSALLTCKNMLQTWKTIFEPDISPNGSWKRGTGLMDKTLNSPIGMLNVSDLLDRDNVSTRAESVAASRIEQTMSGIASSMGTLLQTRKHSPSMWNIQTQIWLELANLYMDKDNLESASECINEASSIQPISHLVAFMRGRYSQRCGDIQDAIVSYRNALSINPLHSESLLYLGQVLHQTNNLPLAEKMLRESINMDPTSSEAWHHLGGVMITLNEHESASECLLKSLEIEDTNPIMPFSIIARTL